ncbi:oligopeptide-binding protein OppA precursor [Clostridium tepidiprofundi DSM 19306]|uniref:Oligopeptide-binding protein OppA n=1 Tax=Clostridium tepidiprofundi DSM 19306 TaxID=1121338 RepID=A0A151B8M9_9CLOT|nr:peptide ABC transporter substrate-binding protein [Clostridium tepidiprofundi]KYH35997.1 oligopeptide-binding protein OppA precursor [Clostridium tepidiprofundi DSM 19306]
MLKSKKTKLGAIILTVAMSLTMLAGCGGTSGDKAEKQIITYNLGAEPKTLDPGTNEAVDGATVVVNAFDGLTRLDAHDNPVAAVAEKWDVSPDGKKYTFHLKKGILWSDGKEVTAKDFEYAWKRALDPKTASGYAYQLYYLKNGEAYNTGKVTDPNEVGVKAIDDYTLEVELDYPTAYFLSLTAFPTYMPLRKDVVDANPDSWFRNPDTYICNGPFKMKEWKPKDQITFVKNDKYWNAKKIKLQEIHYKMIEQETSALAAFKTGQMDFIEGPPSQEIPTLLKNGTAKIYPYLGTYFYCVNVSDKAAEVNADVAKVLKDKRVRKALALAINRKDIVEKITKGGQIPATSFVPPAIAENKEGKDFKDKDYYPPEGNVEEAKKLLSDAGYADGKGFPTITLLYNTNQGHQNIAMAVQDMWRKNLGINVELQNQEWKVFQVTRTNKDYEIARHGWIGDYVDPMTFLDMWTTTSGQNDAGWSNSKYDELIKKAKMDSKQANRMKYMHEAEDILIDEMPVIPIYYYTNVVCIKDYVKNVHKSPLGMVYFDDTYIAKH